MRIGLDARFYHKGSAGLARYTQELIKHVVAAAPQHTFVIFLRPDALPEFRLQAANVEVRTTDIAHYSFREQLVLARQLQAADLDLMHFTNFNYPVRYRRPFIVTIHDLTLLRFAGRSRLSSVKVIPMRQVVARGVKNSRRIITISNYQKKLITQEFAVDQSKVSVIYEAVEPEFAPLPAAEIDHFREQQKLHTPFVMYTGQWRQHKNLVRLIKAFRLVRDQVEARLVLVGKVDRAFPIIQQTIEEQGLAGDVVLTGFVEDADLPRYYNAASVFAFPSLSEGFGLPPLEAMACGTPVAASNASPMPEILGDAPVYFNPTDTAAMARQLASLLHDQKLREKARQAGFAQVKKYSWEQMAAETLDVYERTGRSERP